MFLNTTESGQSHTVVQSGLNQASVVGYIDMERQIYIDLSNNTCLIQTRMHNSTTLATFCSISGFHTYIYWERQSMYLSIYS